MSWHAFDNGKSIGLKGSESGIIIRDMEHDIGARITLERNAISSPFAITCGIYGWMVHTRFFGIEQEAQAQFEIMSAELSKIVATNPGSTDAKAVTKSAFIDSLSEFVERFQ